MKEAGEVCGSLRGKGKKKRKEGHRKEGRKGGNRRP